MTDPEAADAAARAAVEKLEAFFKGLRPEEQNALAPLIAGGILKSVEEATAEVTAYFQAPAFDVGMKPEYLRYLTQDHAPTILDRGEIRGYWPMPY